MEENIIQIKKTIKEDFKLSGWDKILNPFIDSKAFDFITDALVNSIEQNRRFTPKFKEAFNPFIKTNFKEIKVIIVNQDPYPQFGIADGLAFSCSKTEQIQPSLRYIFKELYGHDKADVNLIRWANQGVLLINTSLTCEINKMGSHAYIWKTFIEYVFEMINNIDKNIIFVLMGKKTEYWQIRLPGQKILKCSHPASAVYNKDVWKSNKIFEKINKELEKQIKPLINW